MKRHSRVLLAALLVLAFSTLLTSCGAKKPPYYGAFIKKGGDFVELPEIQIYDVPSQSELQGVPVAPDSQPVVVLWRQETRLQYLQFFSVNPPKELRYNADPKEDGIVELRPADPLDPGWYCFVQGDPLGMGLPAWCFGVRGAKTTPPIAGLARATPSARATPVAPATPVATRVRETDRAVMVFVPAGEFLMGSVDGDSQADSNEKPQHNVTLPGYWIDRTEVTNAQYQKFMDAGGYAKREYWTDAGWMWKEQNHVTEPPCWGNDTYNQAAQPVVCVSWYAADAYAHWAGGRLPTEAEWEKAARGTDGRIYPWGNAWDGTRLNFCDQQCELRYKDSSVNDGYGYTAPVGSYANGASAYGALDLAGNVWEWVSSEYQGYPYDPNDGRENRASTNVRVLRGGSWDYPAPYVRSATRMRLEPSARHFNYGFRVVSPGL